MARRIKEAPIVHQNRIAEKALVLFAKQGIENTKMDEIAAAVGYGKATLYVYFKNKEDIVSFLALQSMEKLRSALSMAMEKEGSVKETFFGLCNALVTFQEEYPTFFERSLQTAEKIRKAVPGIVVNVYDIDDIDKMTEEIKDSDIFANATIVGMKPLDDQSVVKDLSAFHKELVVADAVYNPEETKLLKDAKAAGCKCVGGKGMLLWQGVSAFKLFTGEDMPVSEVKEKFFS